MLTAGMVGVAAITALLVTVGPGTSLSWVRASSWAPHPERRHFVVPLAKAGQDGARRGRRLTGQHAPVPDALRRWLSGRARAASRRAVTPKIACRVHEGSTGGIREIRDTSGC
jgi:hypothetical protein